MLNLYEILVPTQNNEGKPYRKRYHRVWDEKVRKIGGGLTIMPPIKGQWMYNGDIYEERMIPVRIACDPEYIDQIAEMTAKYYQQQAIMYYLISKEVVIRFYAPKDLKEGLK